MGRPPALRLTITLAVALLLASAAGVSALEIDPYLAGGAYTASEKEQVRAVFARAEKQGVPGDLLLPRLVEGTRKKVAPPRLIGVLESLLKNLDRSRAALEGARGGSALLADLPSWSLSATLLETGAGDDVLGLLAAAADGKPVRFRGAGLLYASLVSWGASRAVSLGVAMDAAGSALPPEQYPGLIDLFEQGVRRRVPPERMAVRIHESLPGVRGIDDLRRAVLY